MFFKKIYSALDMLVLRKLKRISNSLFSFLVHSPSFSSSSLVKFGTLSQFSFESVFKYNGGKKYIYDKGKKEF